MKNIGYSSTIYLSILVIIIFLYLNNCKKENFSQLCPDYCHDNKIFYNMDICKPCFSKGGKYEKTKDELDKVNILLLPPHSENCPGICKKTSYRYGICSNCFKKGEIYGDIEENCGNYCHKFSSKTGRCKSCFLKDGRLYVDDTKKKNTKRECREWCNEKSFRYGICAPCFKKGGKFSDIKEPCYEECNEFSSRNGRCSNCFKEGGRYFHKKDFTFPKTSTYKAYISPEIKDDLSYNCPHYCTTKSNKNGSCKACFEKDGIYENTKDICYDYCNIFSNPEGSCKPCFYKGERLYVEPKLDPPPPPVKNEEQPKIELQLYTPPPPPKDHSEGCHWYCNENSYPLGNCSKCFQKDGAFFEVTKKCMNFCTKLNKDLDLCKPCFEKGERLYVEPKPKIEKQQINSIPVENPPKCAEWCNNKFLFNNINYDKYCLRDVSNLGKNCYKDRTHIPEKVIEPESCKCENGTPDKNIDCVKDKTIEKCVTCYDGTTLNSDNKCVLNTCICENGTPHTGFNCPDTTKHSCSICNDGYVLVKNKCYKRYEEYDTDDVKNKYNPIENKGYFNLIENFQDFTSISNYIDPNDGGPVNEDENMSVAKVDNANTLKSCKEHCNIFDTCGGIAYKKGSNDECYTMSTSQSWLSRDNPENLNDIWTTYKRLNPEIPPQLDIDGSKRKIQYFRYKPKIDFKIRFNQNAPINYNYDIDISTGEPTNDITKSKNIGTIESCKKLCKSLDSCGGFSYNKKNNECYLKNNNLPTLSLPENFDYDTYAKMNITGSKPEYPSCPVNCQEETMENLFRDDFVDECVRPQNTGENCLNDYPSMDIIVQLQIDKINKIAIQKNKEAELALENSLQKKNVLELLLFNSEDIIDTHELSSEDLEKKREEERIEREEIERYQKAASAAILLYKNIINTYNEELKKSEEEYAEREIEIKIKREHEEKELNKLLNQKKIANEKELKIINEEIAKLNVENEEKNRLRFEEMKKENQRLANIKENEIKMLQIKQENIEKERAKKERDDAAKFLKIQNEREENQRLAKIAYKNRQEAIKKAEEAAEAARKAKILAAQKEAAAYRARIEAEKNKIRREKELRLAKEKEQKVKRALENRKIAERTSRSIQNSNFVTKKTSIDTNCTNCSIDGKCGDIRNQKCYKPCCTRNGKPQYCSNYGYCGPVETGIWSNANVYKNSNKSKCNSKPLTCSDLNKNYKVPQTKVIKSEVKVGNTILSTNIINLKNNFDKVHKIVTSDKIKTIRPITKYSIIKETNKIVKETKKLDIYIVKTFQSLSSNLIKIKSDEKIINNKISVTTKKIENAKTLIKNERTKILKLEEKHILVSNAEEEAKLQVLKVNEKVKLDALKAQREVDEARKEAEEKALKLKQEAEEKALKLKQEKEEAARKVEEARIAKENAEIIKLQKEAELRKQEADRRKFIAERQAAEIAAKEAEENALKLKQEKEEAARKALKLKQEAEEKALKLKQEKEEAARKVEEARIAKENAEIIKLQKEAELRKQEADRRKLIAERQAAEIAAKEAEIEKQKIAAELKKAEEEEKKLIEEKNKELVAVYDKVQIEKQNISDESLIAFQEAYRMEQAKKIKVRLQAFQELANKKVNMHYKLETTYPDPDNNSKEIRQTQKHFISTKYQHIATMAAYNHLYSDKRQSDGNMTKDFNNLLDISAEEKSPYSGYDSSITGINEIKNNFKTLFKQYINAINSTTSKFKIYDSLQKLYDNIIEERKKIIDKKANTAIIYKIAIVSSTDVLQDDLDKVSSYLPNALDEYKKVKNISDTIRDNILSKLKNEADILTTNQSSKACKYTNIDKKIYGNGELSCCRAAIKDKDGNCCHLSKIDCMGVCGGTTELDACGVCGGYAKDTKMCAEDTQSNTGTDTKQEKIQKCVCPDGWPHGMVYDWTTLEPIKWPNVIDVVNGCTKEQPIKCRGFLDGSPFRDKNGYIKNYCKNNFIPKTATVGEKITEKHLEDSKFLGCKIPKNVFSCPNGIPHNVDYSNSEGHIDSNKWIPVGLERPIGIELKNSVLSALLNTKTTFTDKEWSDISQSFDNKGIIIDNRHYIKSTNDIYYKPFTNNFPVKDGQINCKSCDDGYVLEMKIPNGKTCAVGTGCPPIMGKCIKKEKECACYDPLRADNQFVACYDGAYREMGMGIKYDAGGGNKEISRVGKCHKCYSGSGPWQDPARGSTNTNDTGIKCKTDADCSVEWIGKWDNMPDVDKIDTRLSPNVRPNVLNKNKHKSFTHHPHYISSSKGYSYNADYVLRDNQDKQADNTKAYGRNYKCIKGTTYDGRNLSTTGVCCFGFRPIEVNTPRIGKEHISSNACKRDGQMKCDAEKCKIPVQIDYDKRAKWASITQSLPRIAWGGYNEHTKKCEKYVYDTYATTSNDADTRMTGCNRKYSLIDGRKYTKVGRYDCSALHGGEWNIPDTPNDYSLKIAELDKIQTIDSTISDDTPDSQLTPEQKRREKYAVDKNGNFTHETSWDSPEANASYWNKGEGMGNFDPDKIKLVYY
jgi:hypothetical protein